MDEDRPMSFIRRASAAALLFLLAASVAAPEVSGAGQDHAERDGRRGSDVVDREVTFRSGDVRLVGTLTLPGGPGPFPAVVLISGSGPQDRDGATEGFVPGYRPSRDIADHLAERGIASLRYDERGVGESTGSHASATTADLSGDAEAAFEYLRSREETYSERVGLLGQSEGANIVAMIGARNPDVAFIVSLAGPAVSGYEIVLAQSEHGLRESGLSGEELESAMLGVRAEYDLILGEEWDELEAMMRRVLPAQLEGMPPEERARLGDPEEVIDEELTRMKSWVRFFLTHDPSTDWARVQAPVLAIFGGLDVQVTVKQNRAALEEALRRAPTYEWTVRIFPDANHLFQKAGTGSPDEYFALPPDVAPDVLDAISGWILERTQP